MFFCFVILFYEIRLLFSFLYLAALIIYQWLLGDSIGLFNELMVVFLGFHNKNSISNCFAELEELAALTGSRYGRYIYEQEVDMH